jgi:CRISPR-associated protein Cmr1
VSRVSDKVEVKVTFNTITPLWTGNAWGENSEIRSSSLLGSLRFWFEVICYFSGICNEEDFDKKTGRFEKEVNRKDFEKGLLEKGNSFKAKIECLKEQNIPLPSIIFGTTNWKSLIEIKDIEYLGDYCFGNKLNLPYAIAFLKEDNSDEPEKFNTKEELNEFINNRYKNIGNWRKKQKKFREEYTTFFFPTPYFYGKFSVIFKIEKDILEAIFFPLLTFMEQYGFWGGRWNIGYGRLKVERIEKNGNIVNNWRKDDFELFDNTCFSWNSLVKNKGINSNAKPFEIVKDFLNIETFYCKKERYFETKISNIPLKIKIVKIKNLQDTHFENLIRELLKKKIEIRNCLRPDNSVQDKNIWDEFRHKLLGEQGEGSKILPYVYKENGQLNSGFLSIAGLLNLEKEGGQNG